MTDAQLKIGNVLVNGRIALSPMAGISDSPYRQICRKFGSAFSFTEFVSSDAILHRSEKTFKMLRYESVERPVIFQIFGNKREVIVEAAKIIEELNPDIIDLNMGCSVVKVAHKGAGAGLLKNPVYAGEIIEALKKNIKKPITAKIRIGWDDKLLNYKEVSRILEDSGIDAVFVHGRTKAMGYTGKANWDSIGEIKQMLKVPVFGNGDVLTYTEAIQKIQEYGVDGVLIGRGAIGNPWIFSENGESARCDISEVKKVAFEHLSKMESFYGSEYGLKLFKKHAAKYIRSFRNSSIFRNLLLTSETKESFLKILDDFT